MFSDKSHFGLFSFIKSILAKLICVVISALFGFALVLFVNNRFGFFDSVKLYDYSESFTSSDKLDIPSVIAPDLMTPIAPENDTADTVVPQPTSSDFIKNAMKLDEAVDSGYYISDLPYSKASFTLAKVDTDTVLPKYFSLSNITRQIPLSDGGVITHTEKRPALHARMGFIVMQNEDLSFTLLNSNGRFICNMPPETILLSARDESGNPVFSLHGNYFYYSAEQSAFLPSNYNPSLDVYGVSFDSPSYFNAPKENVYRANSGSPGTWGFRHTDGRQIVSEIYNYAYQFSQGFGVVQNKNGRMSFHNVNGYTRFTDHTFYAPEHNGIENLGFYSFEHGLMRVRELKFNWLGVKTYEREYVITPGNKEFFIPRDYKIESYFDGVFLLSKNGKYGYFNYLGEWICQPVYTYATPFIEGLGVIGYKDGSKGIVDENGEFVVPMVFDEISRCSGGVLTLYDNESGWFIFNKLKTDTPIRDNETPLPDDTVPETNATYTNIVDYANSINASPTYIAEQASYDYTIWLYYNPVSRFSNALKYAPFAPTYFADKAAYDYTMWTYNNPPCAFSESLYSSTFTPTYAAEKASYDYTVWRFYNPVQRFSNALTYVPFETSYIADDAAYDYTMWLYKTAKATPFENAVNTVTFNTTYTADAPAYDYTLWTFNELKANAHPIDSSVAFTPGYIAEIPSYNYTMWLFDEFMNPKVFMNAVDASAFATSYLAEQASHDYTIWLYKNATE
ncbi:MAG: hypothetical protein E7588_02065 [Ruminococcaceae bacterium]|nr:hypothetical protein [Oscillospiraceae bacterium]